VVTPRSDQPRWSPTVSSPGARHRGHRAAYSLTEAVIRLVAVMAAGRPGDVVNVTQFVSMLEKATENAAPPLRPAVAAAARFARDREAS